MDLRRNKKGILLPGLIVAIAFVTISIYAYLRLGQNTRTQTQLVRDTIIAEAYASELLEFFKSMKSNRLEEYLAENPIDPVSGSPYFFCAPINFLERDTAALINEDPLAALPANVLRGTANRYYQIHIVDKTTLNPVPAACDYNVTNAVAGGVALPLLGNNNRFMVTVGVSWNSQFAGIKTVTLNSIIP